MRLKTYMVDTTLRDGEQSAGIAFSKEEKIKLALMMDEIGIFQAEIGIPALGLSEQEAIMEVMARRKQMKIAAWSMMNETDIKLAASCKPDIVHISVPVSYVHIYSVLRKNKQWLKTSLASCVEVGKTYANEVTVGFEDASRADISFIVSLAVMLQEMGIKRLRYADTVGVLTPTHVAQIVGNLKYYTDLDVELHVHNDFGMAVANSIAGAKAGARYVDCTLMGIGERAGNCDALKFVKGSIEILELGVEEAQLVYLQRNLCQILNNHSKHRRALGEK